jgi:GNAT superfamily N-acetyltransferase
MWRLARPDEDDAVVAMCLGLYQEDPGPLQIGPEQARRTLAALRREPWRGRALVLEIDQKPAGYALLIAFWSNEHGGELCEIDELFVAPAHRNQGYGRSLFAALERGELWPAPPVALALGVTLDNARARRLYEGLGFAVVGAKLVKPLARESAGQALGAGEV